MPGTAAGRVCRITVCSGVAPSAREPCRISIGTARSASRVEMMMTGRISRPSAVAPTMTRFLLATPSMATSESVSRP